MKIRDFKLLTGVEDIEEVEEYQGASWIFAREEHIDERHQYKVTEHHYGIHSFLNHFPNYFIVPILSITGPNGIVHCADNEGIGWGFDITRDLIQIDYIRYR